MLEEKNRIDIGELTINYHFWIVWLPVSKPNKDAHNPEPWTCRASDHSVHPQKCNSQPFRAGCTSYACVGEYRGSKKWTYNHSSGSVELAAVDKNGGCLVISMPRGLPESGVIQLLPRSTHQCHCVQSVCRL